MHQLGGIMGTRKPILIFQYSERIKSELIIASELLAKLVTLRGQWKSWRKRALFDSLGTSLCHLRF
jgi:hypothetical protein